MFFLEAGINAKKSLLHEKEVMFQAMQEIAECLAKDNENPREFINPEDFFDLGIYIASKVGRSKTEIMNAIKRTMYFFKGIAGFEDLNAFPKDVFGMGVEIISLRPTDFIPPFLSAKKIQDAMNENTILFIDDFLKIKGTKEEVSKAKYILERLLKERVDKQLLTIISGSTDIWDNNDLFPFEKIFSNYTVVDLDCLRQENRNKTKNS